MLTVLRVFLSHVETSFRNRGLRTNVSTLNPRTSLSVVIQRHAADGVLAVVTLSRANQYSGKIVLRLLDKAGGPDARPFGMDSISVYSYYTAHTTDTKPKSIPNLM